MTPYYRQFQSPTGPRSPDHARPKPVPLAVHVLILMVLWTAVLIVSLRFGLKETEENAAAQALAQARTAVEIGTMYRLWVDEQQGIYIDIEDPHTLPHTPTDLELHATTHDGTLLTRIVAVDMTRLVYASRAPESGLLVRIVSNHPLGPENVPDEWEAKALANLRQGSTGPVTAMVETENRKYLRLFSPMTESEHGFHPGREPGDLYSGVSVSVPMAPLLAAANSTTRFLVMSHIVFWSIGLVVMILGGASLRTRVRQRDQAVDELQSLTGELERRVTERTASLRLRQRQLHSFMDNTEAGAYLKNERHEFVLVNPRMSAILGAPADQLLGSTGYPFLRPATAWKVVELEQRVVREGRAVELHDLFDMADKEGGRIFSLSIFPVLNPDGRLEGTGGILVDVTERHSLEKDLVEAKNAAEKASLAKSAFLANISHEIRTPLNGVIGMADLMLRTDLTPDQASMAATIKNAGDSLLVVLNDVLDLSKIEAGKMRLDPRPFSLRDLIFDAVKGLAPIARTKRLEIIVNISPETPDGLSGDGIRLRQILLNLVSNALKFTNQGEVTITVRVLDRLAAGETAGAERPDEGLGSGRERVRLRFSVQDTGIGIAPEKRKVIFEAFEHADTSTTRNYGGTGLGLAISFRLASMMDSRLCLESEVDRGSTFWFDAEFPIIAEAAALRPQIDPEAFAGFSVLLVDDNEINRKIVMEQLRAWNLAGRQAAGVDEALSLLAAAAEAGRPFSLVLSDLQMPGKDGVALLKAMKSDPTAENIPVVLLSSVNLPEDGLDGLSFAANLVKPVRPLELMRAIATALGIWERFDSADLSAGLAAEASQTSARRLSVLLTEDMEMNQVVAVRMLEELGHQVTVAPDGAQALNLLRGQTFDLIFMDIQMPVMDGLETTANLRRLELEQGRPHTPVVAMTAHALKGDREKFLALGLDDYLTKPILMNELAALIDRLIIQWGLAEPSPPPIESGPAEPPPAAAPKLDLALMRLSFGENQALTVKSMDLYHRDAPVLVEEISAALARGDLAEAAAKAHALKGISSYYTKGEPFTTAADLDKGAKAANRPEDQEILMELAGRLRLEVAALLKEMTDYLNK